MALDVDSWETALEIASQVSESVYGFKVGPRLGLEAQQKDWDQLKKLGPIFYDPKYYDIPNTMLASLKKVESLGVSFCTIHSSSGARAMTDISNWKSELGSNFEVLAVTVLTSFGDSNPWPHLKNADLNNEVEVLTQLALKSGLNFVVCSGHEVSRLKRNNPKLKAICPGVRLPGEGAGDQSRVMTPQKALSEGADFLVVGRSIVEATDPRAAAQKFYQACESFLIEVPS